MTSNTTTGRPPPFSERLIAKREVAEFFGLTESGFARMMLRGEGPPYLRIGRTIRFSPTAVKAWAAGQTEITLPTTETTETEPAA